MEPKTLRSTIQPAALQPKKWHNYARQFFSIKLMAFALLFGNSAWGQTITVDGNPGDWPAVLANNTVMIKGYKVDPVDDHADDKWTMGTQPVDPVSGWYWKQGNVNDKEDIGNTGYALLGHNLYFFADLHANNGDASIGLWLLKGGVKEAAGGTFTGTHEEGDLLVSLAFTNGHVTATPTIYRWTGGALTLVTVGPTVAGAATNGAPVASPWPYTPKKGSAGTYPETSFFEGFVNLDSLQGCCFNPCIGTFLFLTWESQAPHAAESDLVIGGGTTANLTARDTMVCSGNSVPLTGYPAGGTWSGYGVSGNTFNAAGIAPGTYTVSYWTITMGGCVASTTAIVTVKNCHCGCMRAGIAEEPDGYMIYPNPSNGTFDLYLPPLESDAVVEISDIYGRVVDKRAVPKNDIAQQTSYNLNLGAGIYVIRIEGNNIHYSDKIIVK
jgi:hypothetical protein